MVLSEATGTIAPLYIGDQIAVQRGMTSWGKVGFQIETPDGTIEAAQDGGCGCGSRLRSARIEDYL